MTSVTPPKKTRPLRKNPALWLLAGGIAAALTVGLVTRTETPAPNQALSPGPDLSPIPLSLNDAPPPSPHLPTPYQEEWTVEEMPSIEAVRNRRRPSLSPRKDVAEQGSKALLESFECPSPYVRVETGRHGAGDVGCYLKSKEGREIRLGSWVHRNESGEYDVGRYENGRREGIWERYAESGALLERGEYIAGRKEGSWNHYSESGEHVSERNYERGAYHGVVTLYYQREPTVEVWNHGVQLATRSGFTTTPKERARAIALGHRTEEPEPSRPSMQQRFREGDTQ